MQPERHASAAYSRIAVLSAHLSAPAGQISAISSSVSFHPVCAMVPLLISLHSSVAGLFGSCVCACGGRSNLFCPSRQACKLRDLSWLHSVQGAISTANDVCRIRPPKLVKGRLCIPSLVLSDQGISQLSLERTTAMRSELLLSQASPDQRRGPKTFVRL